MKEEDKELTGKEGNIPDSGQGGAPSPQGEPNDIESLLRERSKLDKILREKYNREVTVMFTDIVGSSAYFSEKGDIAGRAMVQMHNDLLFPVIAEHKGIVVKTIGDAIMAYFDLPQEAVPAATAILRTLEEHNRGLPEKEQIHIRVGINTGLGLVEKSDVFGDVVNMAARVEQLAKKDEILISDSTYKGVKGTEDLIIRYHSTSKPKGALSPMDIYTVIWSEEPVPAGITRSPALLEATNVVFYLELSVEGEKIKLCAFEKAEGEERTIKHYEDRPFSAGKVEERHQQVINLLNRANKRGKVSLDILRQLQGVGLMLYDELLTLQVKEKLAQTQARDLLVSLDEHLVSIPWELLYDGEQFLSRRFNMGRVVRTQQPITEVPSRVLYLPLRMLILSDPQGNLPASYHEGIQIRNMLQGYKNYVEVDMQSSDIRVDFVKERIRQYDLVHYAGHATYDPLRPAEGGWLLVDGKLKASQVTELVGQKPLPALVFSNACKSGQTEQWLIAKDIEQQIYGLANAFLLAGVHHYIGTFWEILDEPGASFAQAFYQNLMSGVPIGEALRKAREELVKKYGEETIVWASYMLYGDPTSCYLKPSLPKEVTAEKAVFTAAAAPAMATASQIRAEEEVITILPLKPKARNWPLWGGIMAGVLVVLAFLGYFAFKPKMVPSDITPPAPATSSPPAAEPKISPAIKTSPVIAAVLQKSEAAFSRRQYGEAEKGLLRVTEAGEAAPTDKSKAYNLLGRIYSQTGLRNQALDSYTKATHTDPDSASAHANRGALLEKIGHRQEAVTSLQTALKLNPGDPLALALLAQAQEEQKVLTDRERKARLDKLVSELAAAFRQNKISRAESGDTWTSRPLTVCFLDLTDKGEPPGREGETEALLNRLYEKLREHPRLQVVDRVMLERLLDELKLGSSELADPNAALKLGRILAARVIITGSIFRQGKNAQLTLRLIETETTAIRGALTFEAKEERELLSFTPVISNKLYERLRSEMPLRAKVAAVEGERLTLNVGSRQGAAAGLRLRGFAEGEPIQMEGKTLGRRKIPLGEAEIVSVEENLALARITKKEGEWQKGAKVEELR